MKLAACYVRGWMAIHNRGNMRCTKGKTDDESKAAKSATDSRSSDTATDDEKLISAADTTAADEKLIAAAVGVPHLHMFKVKDGAILQRLPKILGMIRSIQNRVKNVCDFGTQRGALLWPIMNEFPEFQVTAVDLDKRVCEELRMVSTGGLDTLTVLQADVTAPLPGITDKSFDLVLVSEILEHLVEPERAAREAVRLSRKFIIVSVPSKPDDNPEHIQLFTRESLQMLWLSAGAATVKICTTPMNHIAFITVSSEAVVHYSDKLSERVLPHIRLKKAPVALNPVKSIHYCCDCEMPLPVDHSIREIETLEGTRLVYLCGVCAKHRLTQ